MLKRYLFLPLTVALAVMLTMPSVAVDANDGVKLKRKAIPFMIKMFIGEERTITENGDLRVFARCIAFGSGAQLLIFGTSSGPFASGGGGGLFEPAFTESLLVVLGESGTAPRVRGRFETVDVIADEISYMGIGAGSTSLGVNIFGFDCFTAGTAVTILEAPSKRRPHK